MAAYRRILLKLSGEALAGGASFGIDADRVKGLAREVADVTAAGVQVGVVVGGGNIFRGVAAAAQQMDRVTADHMGMLATVINALALSDALEQMGVPTRVLSAIEMHQVAEPYIRRRAIRHLEKGRMSSSRPAPPIRTSLPIPPPLSAPSKSRPTSLPRLPRLTASTTKTR